MYFQWWNIVAQKYKNVQLHIFLRCSREVWFLQNFIAIKTVNAINGNINVKVLLLVFIFKKGVSKHSTIHVVLITIIHCAELYILCYENYV